MKLLGVEIANYACFQRQFVPIREGLNLLVGKNNSGKTALLKALGAFSALQMSTRPYTSQETRKFVNQMTGYLHAAEPMDTYEANVLFEVERGDSLTIARDQESWNGFIAQHRTLARYSFLFMPRQSEDQVIFRSAQLEIEGQAPLNFLESNDKGFLFHVFQLEGKNFKETGTGHIGSNGRSVYGPDAKNHWVQLPSSDYFKPLLPLVGCSYVAAHRVSAPSVDIQTAELLPHNAENLPVFLQTLRGNKPRAFRQIEEMVGKIFPDLISVNPATQANRVHITLSRKDVEQDIPLTHLGTGVEQVLAIATFSITAEPGAMLLLDEPHSFLHPSAERQLIRFLSQDNKHRYLIATHSAVFINSVEAERITHVEAPGLPYDPKPSHPEISRVLLDLGYRNSDILFYDSLVVVEGRSDKTILPFLLKAAGISSRALNAVGYPTMEGVPADARSLQLAVQKHEKLLKALSQSQQPRVYLFDGDRTPQDIELLQGMRDATGKNAVPVKFLPRTEIENYLLVPGAIVAALHEEARLADVEIKVTEATIREKIDEFLKSDEKELFPYGKATEPLKTVKASVLLQRLYSSVENLVYDKDKSGRLIASHLNSKNQPALAELRELLKDALPT
jgi:energy-coupling factor transporter ATP-binding protein EcfA2